MRDDNKAIVTCALTGVLTDPLRHPVPVTAKQMAQEALEAANAGASVVHCHFRRQEPGKGHLPTWHPDTCAEICDAIRAACKGLIINMSTGVLGPDITPVVGALRRVQPDMAALNIGSLNYLKCRRDGTWAWPPLMFDNPVEKIQRFIEIMDQLSILPECECFDTGILRSVNLFVRNGMLNAPPCVSLVMGVASGMPAKLSWLPLLLEEMPARAIWQVIAIGRQDVWPLHRLAARLGGNLRTGLEDTVYLPDGTVAASNGPLVAALVALAREEGRDIASPAEARTILGVTRQRSRATSG